jgi:hypothetical protein
MSPRGSVPAYHRVKYIMCTPLRVGRDVGAMFTEEQEIGRLGGGSRARSQAKPGYREIPFQGTWETGRFPSLVRGEVPSRPRPSAQVRLGESHLWKHCDWRRSRGAGEDLHLELRVWGGIIHTTSHHRRVASCASGREILVDA